MCIGVSKTCSIFVYFLFVLNTHANKDEMLCVLLARSKKDQQNINNFKNK